MEEESTAHFFHPPPSGAPSILRGATRLLYSLNFATVSEFSLKSGRRADLLAVGPTGELWIIEIKSSVADFRADQKWMEYRPYCDRLLFAVSPEFPAALIPSEEGLIVADAYGGTLIRNGDYHPVPATTRKTILIKAARISSIRFVSAFDTTLLRNDIS